MKGYTMKLVKQLRRSWDCEEVTSTAINLMDDAADRIEELEANEERLMNHLQNIASAQEWQNVIDGKVYD